MNPRIRPPNMKTVIITTALLVFVAFSARALVDNREIPESVRGIVYALLIAGMAAGPLEVLAGRKKGDGDGGEGSDGPPGGGQTGPQEDTP